MATQSFTPASAASMIESAAKGGGTKTIEAVAPVFATASFMVSKTGTPCSVSAALAGGDAAHDVGAVLQHFLGVEGADLAGDALHQDRRRTIEKDAHAFTTFRLTVLLFFQAETARSAASASVLARMMGRPERARILRPSSTWVPASRTMTGTSDRVLLQRLDDAFGHPVAAVDAGEDVDQDRLDVLVHRHELEGLGHPLGRGAAADVEEVGRLAARPA